MRWIVIGAGGVGGTIGGLLARAGHEVVLVARGEHGRRIRESGLRLATPRFDEHLRIQVASGPADVELRQDDVFLLAVKSQHTQRALEEWQGAPVVHRERLACLELPVICAQNGIANEPEALRRFETVIGMYVWLPGTYVEPGVVEAQGHPDPGLLAIGAYPPGIRRRMEVPTPDALLEDLADPLRDAGFRVPVVPDVMAWKTAKLLGNLGNAAEAAHGPALSGSRSAQMADMARREGEQVLLAAGVAIADAEELARALDGMGTRPVNGKPRSGGSTWQSLMRGAGSVEVDYLNGEIVRLARLHGLEAPVNRRLQLHVNYMLARGVRPGEGGQRL